MSVNHGGQVRDKGGTRTLGFLFSLYQNDSSRILLNSMKTSTIILKAARHHEVSLSSSPFCAMT